MVFLGAMSALSHVVFIWFHFKKRNERKWKETEGREKQKLSEKLKSNNKEKKQNKINHKIKLKKISMSVLGNHTQVGISIKIYF